MAANLSALLYVVSGVLFIMALRGLSHPTTSRQGNFYGMVGMGIAIATTIVFFPPSGFSGWLLVVAGIAIGGGIGAFMAKRVQMTQMPQLVAFFHSLVGLAAVLVAAAALYAPEAFGIGLVGQIKGASLFEMGLGVAIGAITFTGSIIAFLKLDGRMSGKPIMLPQRHGINIGLGIALVVLLLIFLKTESHVVFWLIVLVSFALGVLLIIPIGGADMPVVVSMLNSYSGWAAAGIGFTLGNMALIITGALVGSSGAILSYIMCKAMNRSFISVILGGFGGEDAGGGRGRGRRGQARQAGLGGRRRLHHEERRQGHHRAGLRHGGGAGTAYAARDGRPPQEGRRRGQIRHSPGGGPHAGHMNVLLAEANVPYDEVFELEDINSEFGQADVAFVIGANDVTNPAAKTDKASPIYGMPILDVEKAKTVLFIKRGMAAGYAGVENELFFRPNTMMLFGDAKKVTDDIVKAMAH